MAQEITVGARGVLRPQTLGEAMEFAKMVAGSGMVPTAYRGKAADILIAMQMGAELGFSPMQALRGIAVINGQPSVYGDAAMALVRGSGLCESVAETVEGEGDHAIATCAAKRKGQAALIVARFSVADARKAGLWGKAGPWQQYPLRMLAMRARGFCLRDGFADVLRGVITAEEAQDYPSTEPRDITPTPAADLDTFAAQTALPAPADDPTSDPSFVNLAEDRANEGIAALEAWWKTLSKANKQAILDHMPRLKALARQVDAANDPNNPFGLPALGEPDETPAAAQPLDRKENAEIDADLPGSTQPPPRVTDDVPARATDAPGSRARAAANRGQMAGSPPASATPPFVRRDLVGEVTKRLLDAAADGRLDEEYGTLDAHQRDLAGPISNYDGDLGR